VTTGIATINTLHEEFSLLSSVALLKPSASINNRYLKATLNYPTQYSQIRENMGGAAITRLTISKIEKIKIPLPPLSLQQTFAAKIEAIEQQKTRISQSIAEAQKLFDYTMDKYFG
ncbi:MAG: restriction endonuclease subunit S, partial [Bacteroidales bacterium]|nr:restriction endonuclease subunit S [Bacteroidales bacterium]